jgi:hypothetical protein
MRIHRDSPVPKIATGDRIRVHTSAEAIAAGVAGMVGEVIGLSAPSDSIVAVVGVKGTDELVNVSLKEKEGTFWFAKNQLEIVEHAPKAGAAPEPAAAEPKPKQWWRFGL